MLTNDPNERNTPTDRPQPAYVPRPGWQQWHDPVDGTPGPSRPVSDADYIPNPALAPKPNHTGRILAFVGVAVLIMVVGLLVGFGVGRTTAQAAPGTTPQSCLDALDYADNGFDLAADGFGAARDMFAASIDLDMPAFDRAVSDMDRISGEMNDNADKYNPAKAACRAGR